jgi:hypothetical protein
MWDKRTLFETNARVPLIIHDPDHPETYGMTAGALAENVDVFPTLIELAGLPDPANKLFPPLEGQSGADATRLGRGCPAVVRGLGTSALYLVPVRRAPCSSSRWGRCPTRSWPGLGLTCAAFDGGRQEFGAGAKGSRKRRGQGLRLHTDRPMLQPGACHPPLDADGIWRTDIEPVVRQEVGTNLQTSACVLGGA